MEEFQGTAPSARPVRREFTCISCGHSIRGLGLDALCPECGTPVMHSVNSTPSGARTSGYAIASLVLGILSVVSCVGYGLPAILFSPLAILFSSTARKEVREGRADSGSKGMAIAGLVCGIIGLIPLTFVAMFLLFGLSAGFLNP